MKKQLLKRILPVLLLCVFAASCKTTPEQPPSEVPSAETPSTETVPEALPVAEESPVEPTVITEDRLKSGSADSEIAAEPIDVPNPETPEAETLPDLIHEPLIQEPLPPEEETVPLPAAEAPAPLEEETPEIIFLLHPSLSEDSLLAEDLSVPTVEPLRFAVIETVPELSTNTEPNAASEPVSVPEQTPATAEIPLEDAPMVKIIAEELPTPKGGIWLYEPAVPYIQENSVPGGSIAVTPSRTVTVNPDQYLDILYPGSGWMYLGDIQGLDGMLYYGRKLKDRDTLFSLRGKTPGTYILHFSRQDVISDSYVDDWLQVTVEGAPYKGTERIHAPLYIPAAPATAASGDNPVSETNAAVAELPAPAIPKAPPVNQETTAESAGSSTTLPLTTGVGERAPSSTPVTSSAPAAASPAVPGAPVEVPNGVPPTEQNVGSSRGQLSSAQLLTEAEAALIAGDSSKALDLLNQFFRTSVTNLDEGWFLRGQAYEENGSTRNIRRALDAYKTVVDAFPSSPRWREAQERITYINRFYFNIR
ncbi:MAG: hypothetical protein LBU99_00240 [Spirochaetaceae bacterium]|nr:hypothetical protein [Spirochaetaceae bacterium]